MASKIKNVLLVSYSSYALLFPKRNKEYIRKEVNKVITCRTEAGGCRAYKCPDHTVFRIVPHSCGSRFCTICSSFKTKLWVENKAILLTSMDTPYYFLTFTLPGSISRLIQENKELLLDEVFHAVSQALLGWCKKHKNFVPGLVMILQTSGDQLNYHVHIHLLITAGGLREEKEWIALKPKRRELPRNGKKFHPAFPPQVITARFKALINRALRRAYQTEDFKLPAEYFASASSYKDFNKLLDKWWQIYWNIDFSDPLNNTKEIIGYIARYIKKPPISNRRIIEHNESTVKFLAKDRKSKSKKRNKIITMTPEYFLLLLLEHVPLPGFRLIRWYGIFANRNKKHLLPIVQKLIPPVETADPPASKERAVDIWRKMHEEHFGVDPLVCPICGKELVLVAVFFPKQLTSLGLSFESIPKFLMS